MLKHIKPQILLLREQIKYTSMSEKMNLSLQDMLKHSMAEMLLLREQIKYTSVMKKMNLKESSGIIKGFNIVK